MKARQVSVFVENRPGRLAAILDVLEAHSVSILALSVSDAAEIGIIRMVLSDPDSALRALREEGFTSREDPVLCVAIPDVPGGLLRAVGRPLAAAGVNLDYFYVYTASGTDSVMAVIKTDDMEKAERAIGA